MPPNALATGAIPSPAAAYSRRQLNAIRSAAVDCEYRIPIPGGGGLDPNKVNVQYTPGGGKQQIITRVFGQGACPASGNGRHYDSSAAPTKIVLCPSTCMAVKQDTNAQPSVALGCSTMSI